MFRRSPEVQKHIYFFVQKLRREPVKEAWEKIQAIDHTDKNALKERVISRGTEHLVYVLNYVPKYMQIKNKSYLINLIKKVKTIEEFEDVLKEFPITEKREIIENPEKLTSILNNKINTYVTYSSGTTGHPVQFPKDMRDWAQSHANMLFIITFYKVNPFAPSLYLWAGDWAIRAKIEHALKDLILNRIRFTPYNLNTQKLLRYYKMILKYKPHFIYGLPSLATVIAQFIYNEGLKPPTTIKAVFTTGETLKNYQKKIIQSAFNSPVVDIYGCSETGIIGFSCINNHIHLLLDTNYVEILDDGHILVTNFLQKSLPIVRYKIGDISNSKIIWENNCNLAYPHILGIEGRESNSIKLPNGKILPTLAPTYVFDKVIFTGAILKFRYELKGNNLILKLVVNSKFNSKLKNIIVKDSKKIFGLEPIISIVNDIPPLPGGKDQDFIILDKDE